MAAPKISRPEDVRDVDRGERLAGFIAQVERYLHRYVLSPDGSLVEIIGSPPPCREEIHEIARRYRAAGWGAAPGLFGSTLYLRKPSKPAPPAMDRVCECGETKPHSHGILRVVAVSLVAVVGVVFLICVLCLLTSCAGLPQVARDAEKESPARARGFCLLSGKRCQRFPTKNAYATGCTLSSCV